jgi:hypothetical protein
MRQLGPKNLEGIIINLWVLGAMSQMEAIWTATGLIGWFAESLVRPTIIGLTGILAHHL